MKVNLGHIFSKEAISPLWRQRLAWCLRLEVQFVLLLGLFFAHQHSLFHLFASKQEFTRSELKQTIFSQKGFVLPQKIASKLVGLRISYNYKTKHLYGRHLIFRTALNRQGARLYLDGEGRMTIWGMNKEGYFIKDPSLIFLKPKTDLQFLVEIDNRSHTTEVSVFKSKPILQGVKTLRILKYYRTGSAKLYDSQIEVRGIRLNQAHKGEKLKAGWAIAIYQNRLQQAVEIGYYLWWTLFWGQVVWHFLKRILAFAKQVDLSQINLLQNKALLLFVILLQSYLLVAIFAGYILPWKWFHLWKSILPGFLHLSWDRLSDFYSIIAWAASPNPYINDYGWGGPVYYPFIMLLMKPLVYFEMEHLKWGFVMFSLWLAWYISHAFAPKNSPDAEKTGLWLFVITVCSYPFLLGLDRGNIDLLILLFVVLYILNDKQGRWFQAGVWLGFGIAAKAFPGLFVLLSLRKREWKAPLVAGLVVIAVSLAAMEIFGGDYARSYLWFNAYFRHFQNNFLIGTKYSFNHFSDPYSLIKIFTSEGLLPFTTATLYKYYSKVALLLILLIAYVVLFKKDEPEYLHYAMIGTGVVVFPGLAYDYRLIFLFPALYAFFYRTEAHPRDRVFWVYLWVILVPKHFGLIAGKWFLSCFVNPLWNLALLAYGGLPHATWQTWMQNLADAMFQLRRRFDRTTAKR